MKNLLVISNYNGYYVHTRFMNYITNKTNNYIISSDLNVESRLNNSTLNKMNKANNYYRGGYISMHIPLSVKSIIATSINSMATIC